MADELRVTYNGSDPVYAVIQQLGGDVWNGSAFETWADGNIGDYDIPLSNAGGDLYTEDFPALITTSATYRVAYYRQDGGSPAIDDPLLNAGDIVWTGTDAAAAAPVGGDVQNTNSNWVNSTTVNDVLAFSPDISAAMSISDDSAITSPDVYRKLVEAQELIYGEFETLDASLVATTDAMTAIRMATTTVVENLAGRGVSNISLVREDEVQITSDPLITITPWVRRIFARYLLDTRNTSMGQSFGANALLRR